MESMMESMMETARCKARAGSDRGDAHSAAVPAASAAVPGHAAAVPTSSATTVPAASATAVETAAAKAATVTTAAASVAATTAAAATSECCSWLNQADRHQCEQGYNRFAHYTFPPLDEVRSQGIQHFRSRIIRRSDSVRSKLTVSQRPTDEWR
jgi:hypothetical protein